MGWLFTSKSSSIAKGLVCPARLDPPPNPLPRGGVRSLTMARFLASKIFVFCWYRPMADQIIPYNPKLKTRARELRKNMTPGEQRLWQFLRGKQVLGFDFDRQRPIDQFIVDFYCKKLRLAIEIDGASHDSENAQIADAERQARLEAFGIRFLRFQEREALRETEAVVKAIELWILENQDQ